MSKNHNPVIETENFQKYYVLFLSLSILTDQDLDQDIYGELDENYILDKYDAIASANAAKCCGIIDLNNQIWPEYPLSDIEVLECVCEFHQPVGTGFMRDILQSVYNIIVNYDYLSSDALDIIKNDLGVVGDTIVQKELFIEEYTS